MSTASTISVHVLAKPTKTSGEPKCKDLPSSTVVMNSGCSRNPVYGAGLPAGSSSRAINDIIAEKISLLTEQHQKDMYSITEQLEFHKKQIEYHTTQSNSLLETSQDLIRKYERSCEEIEKSCRVMQVKQMTRTESVNLHKTEGEAKSLERLKSKMQQPKASSNRYSNKMEKLNRDIDLHLNNIKQAPKSGSGINLLGLSDWDSGILRESLPSLAPENMGSTKAWSDEAHHFNASTLNVIMEQTSLIHDVCKAVEDELDV